MMTIQGRVQMCDKPHIYVWPCHCAMRLDAIVRLMVETLCFRHDTRSSLAGLFLRLCVRKIVRTIVRIKIRPSVMDD